MEEKKSKDSRIRILIKIAILMVLYVSVTAILSICLDKLIRYTDSDTAITSLSVTVCCLLGISFLNPLMIDLFDKLDSLKEQSDKEKTFKKLISADSALKKVKKKSQIDRAIKEIDFSIKCNSLQCFICNGEKLTKETIDILISKGYDIEINFFTYGREHWSNKCLFDENSSGKIFYLNEEAKVKLGYEKDKNDNRD